MDFMKVIDQTVREIKREVNLKVLKVPEIEQKVLDATDDEPWGPHGSALAEIAQATKKFSECQMVMGVLWTRLSETGRNWRYVYKALAVIEYLIANGSERAVDDITEHTYQISSLASFEYVEPSGKDMGINVRKKAENIVALLNNRDRIQEVRNKAAATRDKYFGLSSSGITYKSGSASLNSSSFQSSNRYGGFSGFQYRDSYKDSYKDDDQFGEEKFKPRSTKSSRGVMNDSQGNSSKKGSTRYGSKDQRTSASGVSKSATMTTDSDKYISVSAQSLNAPSNNYEDDFDPRGTSSSTKSAAGSSNQVDLFEPNLFDGIMDAPASIPKETLANAPASIPKETSTLNSNPSEVDLFADASFVSASPHIEAGTSSETQATVDLFASQPPASSAVSSSIDFFAAADPSGQPEKNSLKPEPMNKNAFDPFAAIPLNNFDRSDPFGEFTSNADAVSIEAVKGPDCGHNNLNGQPSTESNPSPKKENFQVKSGVWADSLSRGLIDLNITAPKKVSLADIGIVGGLSDVSDEKERGPSTSFHRGRAMGAGSGLGMSGFTQSSSVGTSGDLFSSLGGQQNQFGNLK
ncbi:hypothetical protein NMG60_11027821 [Bertholletia excelsa]